MPDRLQDAVDHLFDTLGTPVVLSSSRHEILRYSAHPEDLSDPPRRANLLSRADVTNGAMASRVGRPLHPVILPADEALQSHRRIVVPLRFAETTYGYLFLVDRFEQIDIADLSIFEPLFAEMSAALALDADIDFDGAAALLHDEAAVRAEGARMVGRSLRIRNLAEHSSSSGFAVAVVWVGDDDTAQSRLESGRLFGPSALATNIAETVAVIFQTPREGLLPGSALRSSSRPTAVGPGVRTLTDVHVSYGYARRALRLARVEQRADPVFWDQLGAWKLLLSIAPEEITHVLDPRAAVLLDTASDEEIALVTAYLENPDNVSSLSTKLHLHRGTIYNRLRQLGERCGFSFKDEITRSSLLSSLRLARLRSLDE